MAHLAVDGGTPVRKTYLPYGKQQIDDSDRRAVAQVLDNDYITRGPKVLELETAIAEYCEMPYAVAFSSATAGLHAAMQMMGVDSSKKVGVPCLTFAATANSVLYCGGKVKFLDVRADTLNVDESKANQFEDCDILYSVDFAGNPCDYEKLASLKKPIVVDAAHSFGAKYKNQPVGQLGDCSVFSFHPVKSMTMAEGGCVVVRDKEQAEFLRSFRAHGILGEIRPGYFEQTILGYNYSVTELQAALGLSQIKRMPQFISRRNEIADRYLKELSSVECIDLPKLTEGASSAWHLFPIRLKLEKLSVSRDEFLRVLRAENIGGQVHYIPVYLHPYYQSLGFKPGLCPVAEKEYAREISLPIFPAMSDEDAGDVVAAVQKLADHFSK